MTKPPGHSRRVRSLDVCCALGYFCVDCWRALLFVWLLHIQEKETNRGRTLASKVDRVLDVSCLFIFFVTTWHPWNSSALFSNHSCPSFSHAWCHTASLCVVICTSSCSLPLVFCFFILVEFIQDTIPQHSIPLHNKMLQMLLLYWFFFFFNLIYLTFKAKT